MSPSLALARCGAKGAALIFWMWSSSSGGSDGGSSNSSRRRKLSSRGGSQTGDRRRFLVKVMFLIRIGSSYTALWKHVCVLIEPM